MNIWMGTCRSASALMWWAAIHAPASISKPAQIRPRRAVEKTGPWKRWKNHKAVFHRPHRPLKSRNPGGIPTFPPLRRLFLTLSQTQTQRQRPASPPSASRRGPADLTIKTNCHEAEADKSCVNQTGQIDKLRTRALSERLAGSQRTGTMSFCLRRHERQPNVAVASMPSPNGECWLTSADYEATRAPCASMSYSLP